MADRKITDLSAAEAQDLSNNNTVVPIVNPDRTSNIDKNRKASLPQLATAMVEQGLVEGPASSTSGRVAVFDNTDGTLLRNGTILESNIIVEGDARLTNARTPTAHGNEAHTSTFVVTSDSRLSDARTPTAHGNEAHTSTFITAATIPVQSVNTKTGAVVLNATDVGADPAGTGASAAASAVSTHNSATTSVHGIANTANLVLTNDSRLSDARTPTAHGNEAHTSTFITAAQAPVQSVAGKTGSVTLAAADVSGVVDTSTGQTVGGAKTFSSNARFNGSVGVRRDPVFPVHVQASGTTGANVDVMCLRAEADGTATARLLFAAFGTSGVTNSIVAGVGGQAVGAAKGALRLLTMDGTLQERMHINPEGNVGINTSSPGRLLHVNGTIRYTNRPAAGSITAIGFDANGDLTSASSSERYKYDIVDYEKGLETVLGLRPVAFKYNNETRENIGFIAEEVDALGLGEVVVYDEGGQPNSVMYGNLVALLTKAVQELAARVSELEALNG